MQNKSKKKSKKWVIWVIAILIVFAAVLPSLTKAETSSGDEVVPKVGDLSTYYSFSGSIQAKNRQMVYSQQAVQISEFKVEEGSIVNEGDVLYVTKSGDEVKAETEGEVFKIYVDENEQIMPGVQILEIVDYSNLLLNVKVDENDLAAVEEDKQALVTINALSKDVEGAVTEVSKEGTYMNGVTVFTAAISIPGDESIKVGMSAEAKILKDQVSGVLLLPVSAVQFDDNNHAYVYMKNEEGKLEAIEVELGITDGVSVEIISGLSADDTVFVPKEQTFEPGGGLMEMNRGGIQ